MPARTNFIPYSVYNYIKMGLKRRLVRGSKILKFEPRELQAKYTTGIEPSYEESTPIITLLRVCTLCRVELEWLNDKPICLEHGQVRKWFVYNPLKKLVLAEAELEPGWLSEVQEWEIE